jgi:hypothetical protein
MKMVPMQTNMETKEKIALAKRYEPTGEEKTAMEATRARRVKTPRIKATPTDKAVELSLDHPDGVHGRALLMSAFGTGEGAFIDELLVQLGRASSDGAQQPIEQNGQRIAPPNEQRLNFFAAVIKGIRPKDEVESMIAAQMAVIHSLTMEFASKLALAGDLIWRDSAERTLNRLARTFTALVEALKRYRSSSEQTIKVEHQHVTVNNSGQALVAGNVAGGIGSTQKKESTS